MALVDLIMPKMGESITEATILKWHKQPGDKVKEDETVLEIATDKVDTEVPSIREGVIEEILFNVNDVVPVGAILAKIRTEAAETKKPDTAAIATAQTETASITQPVAKQATVNSNRFYSPLVLNIAANEGVSLSELERIPGTGNEGRVTKHDILQYVSGKQSGSRISKPQEVTLIQPSTTVGQQPSAIGNRPTDSIQQPSISYSGNTEIIEMDRMRKLIAGHMVNSKHTSAHVTSFTESDVTHMVQWREKTKKDFEKREGTKITFTPLFIEAVVRCIKKYPLVNSSVDGDKIIIKKDIHIGMATALPNGNLIVPVIKNADQLNLVGLAKQVNALADNARNNKLKPEDTQGGTFTLTNVGTFGSLMGTPIINQPQVAILAVGAIKKRPVVIETSQGDSIAIRHMMYLSLSYDHRIIDGSLGATFLTAVANELQNFNPERDF
ncbi:MAG: 2-oxo acid dehydrogenase subunit E2 [Bacteroidetes bacterium]|nr:2-oxo acid dehydrogenase subunit E2 [Bacteroidota bacterium]